MRVLIVGCGRVGGGLARRFDSEGHAVTIVDTNPAAFGRLGKSFGGRAYLGDGMDETVLRRCGIETCDAFVSVTNGDNRNLMAAQIAREIFQVPRVITRIKDPIREQVYRELGLETVCPTAISTRIIRDYVLDGVNKAQADPGISGSGTAA